MLNLFTCIGILSPYIYKELSLDGFDKDIIRFRNYLESLKDFKKNNYRTPENQIQTVIDRWGFAFERYGYRFPDIPERKAEKIS